MTYKDDVYYNVVFLTVSFLYQQVFNIQQR
jgi:hypothetical protein